ncbi:response regulator [Paenibacillus polymyxa]|uniref:Response regulatory domain-containing protein n=1 Tax=Paenibacillus polymyxa (strain SC2) TaxID=886882 RepID=A0A0D5ZCS0_PAEPS|nr:response regulator [Paenibacillus polymyxa]AKA44356.1 hypothetical protein PPSC2_26510 [Paenibacillus polymyxa SC2]WPQ60031.1 response regulator [Paenibacillus polymyxa]
MRLLIIEDDDHKADKVSHSLEGHVFERARSYNTGLRNVLGKKTVYDRVILDMGLPKFDDGNCYEANCGLLILEEMRRNKIKLPVLIHSSNQFDISNFPNVLGYIVASNDSIVKEVNDFIFLIS